MDHKPKDHEGIHNDEDILEDLHLAADLEELQITDEGNQYLLQLIEELNQDPEFPWSFLFTVVLPTSMETHRDRCLKLIWRHFDRNGLLKIHFMGIEMTSKYPS
jgi:hypothetical protein